jgi:membrane protease YdiL (CAAX protease family)
MEASGRPAQPGRPGQAGQPGQPGQPGPGRGLTPHAIWWLLPGATAALLLSGIGAAIGQGLTGRSNGAVTDLLGEVGLWAAMIGTVSLASRRQGTASLGRDFGLVRLRWKDLLPAFLAAASALVVSELVVQAFAGTRFSGSNTQIITSQRGHEAGLVVVSVLVAVGAPFFEELFFRGYLRLAFQRALERLFARRSDPERLAGHGGVWLQAALFGLAHFGEARTEAGNVSVVVAMLLVGVVLGYAARLTGRLGPGMIAHGAFNLLAVISVV